MNRNVGLTAIMDDHAGRKSACWWEMGNYEFIGLALILLVVLVRIEVSAQLYNVARLLFLFVVSRARWTVLATTFSTRW